jgi:crotonobetainyl-CoA:carnitine CoA-transferase CaiB-like acyl-CoA transferase
VLNAGKRSVTIDLKSESGIRQIERLIAEADILVEQFRPGVMDRLGLGYAAARRVNPRLIYCSITGYGQEGPRAQEAGHDINYQAVTGLLSLSPGMPAALVADIAGGAMPAVMNILLALRQRDLTGEGAHLDIAMADAMFTFSWFALAQGHATGRFPGPGENMLAGGSPRYGLYQTRDGRFLAVGALEQKFWDAFCAGIDLPAALRDDRRDPEATRAEIRRIVGERDSAAWQAILAPLDCCCTLVASLDEALEDPHFRDRGLMAYAAAQGGATIPLAALPLSRTLRRDTGAPRAVAGPGDHTEAVLGASGSGLE